MGMSRVDLLDVHSKYLPVSPVLVHRSNRVLMVAHLRPRSRTRSRKGPYDDDTQEDLPYPIGCRYCSHDQQLSRGDHLNRRNRNLAL